MGNVILKYHVTVSPVRWSVVWTWEELPNVDVNYQRNFYF
jgi:hypothetical protein